MESHKKNKIILLGHFSSFERYACRQGHYWNQAMFWYREVPNYYTEAPVNSHSSLTQKKESENLAFLLNFQITDNLLFLFYFCIFA